MGTLSELISCLWGRYFTSGESTLAISLVHEVSARFYDRYAVGADFGVLHFGVSSIRSQPIELLKAWSTGWSWVSELSQN